MSSPSVVNGFFRALGRDRLLAHNSIVAGGSLFAGVVGLGFQVVVSHGLRPSDYGAVFASIAVITLLGSPATGFSLVMARQASRDRATGECGPSTTLLSRGRRAVIGAGFVVGITLVLLSPILSSSLSVPVSYILAVAAGIPFGWALSLLLGQLQGEQRFTEFAALNVGQALLKLIGAISLGALIGPVGVIAGITIATLVVYFAAAFRLRGRFDASIPREWIKPAARYLAVILPSTLALSALLNSDVLIVKHYFSAHSAGEYAAMAAMGRAVYWGAAGVAGVLFAKVIFRETRGHTSSETVGVSLALVAAGALAALVLLSVGSRWLIGAFAGPAYLDAAQYVPWYALGMSLLGGAAVLIATHQSRGRARFLAVLVPVTVLEPLALAAFHADLLQVVQVVDVAMATLFAGMAVLALVEGRSAVPQRRPVDASVEAMANP